MFMVFSGFLHPIQLTSTISITKLPKTTDLHDRYNEKLPNTTDLHDRYNEIPNTTDLHDRYYEITQYNWPPR